MADGGYRPARMSATARADATLRDDAAGFWTVGLLSFGGPAGQIAVMHRVFVEERGWLDEERFLHALNYCMVLPGPEAMQLATYVGWLRHGWRGGVLAGLAFVLPGLAMILALSALVFAYGDVPLVAGLLFGVKAAVLAIVLEALLKVSRRALKGPAALAVAATAFVAIAFLDVPFPLIVLGAALFGALRYGVTGERIAVSAPRPASSLTGASFRTLAVWGSLWALPAVALFAAFGPDGTLPRMAAFFSQAAIVTFGGAYAVLAYVAQAAVETYGWLLPGEMVTGLGLAETTLGPLVLVLVFVGFMGGARAGGDEWLSGGLAGGLVAAWFTFVPCFFWVFLGAPYMERLREVRWLAAALAAVTAAVVGVIANLGLWFALRVLFGEPGEARFGPFSLPVPDLGALDPGALGIAVAASVALLRFHANVVAVLAAAALAGLALA